jgi:hypothetical protein
MAATAKPAPNLQFLRYVIAHNCGRTRSQDEAYQSHVLLPLYLWTTFTLTTGWVGDNRHKITPPWHEVEEDPAALVEKNFGTAPS